MRSSWSQLVFAGLAVVFAAAAGSLLSSGTTTLAFFVGVTLAVGAAMVCGGAAAVQVFRAQVAAGYPPDNGDLTIDLEKGVPATQRPPLRSLRPLFSFVAASSATVALAVILLGWSDTQTEASPALPMVSVATPAEAAAAPEPEAPATSEPAARTVAAAPSRVSLRPAVNPSLARQECLAQIESAHLFLGIAREAKGVGAYTRLSNTQIKRYQAARPVDAMTLQRIALGMWEMRDRPDRDSRWWSSQFASCEQARVAGAGYVVRG